MTIKEINEKINALMDEGYEAAGFRADDIEYSIGDILPVSRVWDDGEPTDETLGGTSVIDGGDYWTHSEKKTAEGIKLINMYMKKHIYLVATKGNYEGGEDIGEIVMSDCEVICEL